MEKGREERGKYKIEKKGEDKARRGIFFPTVGGEKARARELELPTELEQIQTKRI